MKKLIIASMILGYTLFWFTSCGNNTNCSTTNNIAIESITIGSCDASQDIDSYTTYQDGDNIVVDSQSVTTNKYFGTDGNQKICLESGLAHLERG